jgi:MFS family permease
LITQGLNLSYTYGNYPTFVRFITEELQTINGSPAASANAVPLNIAYAFLLYGIGSLVGSLCWGRLYDRLRTRLPIFLAVHLTLFTGTLTLLASLTLHSASTLRQHPSSLTAPSQTTMLQSILAVGALLGLCDSLSTIIVNNSISKFYSGPGMSQMFSWYRGCFCAGFAGAAGLSSAVPRVQNLTSWTADGWTRMGWLLIVCLNVVMVVVSVCAGLMLDRRMTLIIKDSPRMQRKI